jgi:hypothetical protein
MMIRSLQFTDVAALLLFLGKAPANEARTRDRLGRGQRESRPFIPLLRDSLISGDKRHNLVCAASGRMRGVACLRRRGGPSVWEIEYLLLARGHEDCCVELLEKSGACGDEAGIERLFLRLDSDSPAVDMARQAGFSQYVTECLYCIEGERDSRPVDLSLAIRSGSRDDEYKLFRLYSAAVPVQVRSVEGMTFQEWSQSRERPRSRESVFERDNEALAWLRTGFDRAAGQLDVVSTLDGGELGQVVDQGLSVLRGRQPVYCLVPEFQVPLRRVIEERGFRQVAQYCCLSKQLAVRVREPRLVPLQA